MKEMFILNPHRKRRHRRGGSMRRSAHRRRRFRRNPVGKSFSRKRRSRRRSGGGRGRNITAAFTSALQRPTLMLGAGLAAGNLLGQVIYARFGPVKNVQTTDSTGKVTVTQAMKTKDDGFVLPGTVDAAGGENPLARNLWIAVGSVLAGGLVNYFAPKFRQIGDGAIVGGVGLSIASAAARFTAPVVQSAYQVAGTKAYLNAPYVPSGVGRFGGARIAGTNGLMVPSKAFKSSAFTR